MFPRSGKRFITPGIRDNVPLETQLFLWSLIDQLAESNSVPVDYLQVFELKPTMIGDTLRQQVIHRQEEPPYECIHVLSASKTVDGKIFVIDDTTHATMLFAHEY